MRRIVAFGPTFVVLLTAVVMLLAVPAAVRRIGAAQTSARIVLARAGLDQDDILERLNQASRDIADSVRPSIVHIDARNREERFRGRSAGSGWVYDGRGHIVTNAHVLFGASRVTIQFSDGRILDAETVGEPDPYTDIAVLKVNAFEGLFPARRATDEEPHQGDRVFVFGSPFGFKFSMSEGIVSGLGREAATANDFGGYTNFIQTDAAVNPGNSGGPLVDIKGRVIGMNVAIATGRDSQGTTEGQSAGISFAIPLATIESVVDQIITAGSVSRGFLGISYPPRFGDPDVPFDESIGSGGVRVVQVTEDGPADRAGIQPGDIITKIANRPVVSWNVLRSVVSNHRPGDQIGVTAWREGKPTEFTVTLGQLPGETLARGGAVSALQRFGLGPDVDEGRLVVGVVITGSAAEEAGFEPGQVILRVGQEPVDGVEEFLDAISRQGVVLGRRVTLTVLDDDEQGEPQERSLIMRITR